MSGNSQGTKLKKDSFIVKRNWRKVNEHCEIQVIAP
nr:MAG TPA: hypothetical protein [Caudoviricetes sp.]